jgi:hypothetical protein
MPTVKPTIESVVKDWLSKGRTELSFKIALSECKGRVFLTLQQRTCGCGCARQHTPKLTSVQREEIQTLINKLKELFKKAVQKFRDFGTGLTFVLVPQPN